MPSNLPSKGLLIINYFLINLPPLPSANFFAGLFTCPQTKLTDFPHLHWHIIKNLFNCRFCKSLTNKVSVALEQWRAEDCRFRGFVILALSVDGEGVGKIWEVRVSTSKNIGWWTYYHFLLLYYYIYLTFLLYFENKEMFCSCVWLPICSTFCNLIYCSFVGICDLILSLALQIFPYWGDERSSPSTSTKSRTKMPLPH